MGVMHIPGHTHQAPREVALEEIEAVLGDCHLCQLYQSRHNIVFGVGNPRARVMMSISPTCLSVARRETAIRAPRKCWLAHRFCASRFEASGPISS